MECIKCHEPYAYLDSNMYICPMCGEEWNESETIEDNSIKDANGNILNDGDTVIVMKDLKVKGASAPLKQGTKVKNIRLNYDSDHNIDCKIDGLGAMQLKSEFVKKL